MLFSIVGEVSTLSPLKQGQSRNGKSWKSQEFVVLVQEDQYMDAYCVQAFGDKVDRLPEVGDEVEVKFSIRSREYNGRWYTELNLVSWDLKTRADAESAPTASIGPITLPSWLSNT